MARPVTLLRGLLLAAAAALLLTASAGSQPAGQPTPKAKPSLAPVAETRLIMEGLANVNFRGLEKLLKTEPDNVQAWTFARGQALLIAETANLLMIRPPKGQGQELWFNYAMNLRVQATQLAQGVGSKDYAKSKAYLVTLGKTCSACHQSFNVPVQIVPFAQETGLTQEIGFKP